MKKNVVITGLGFVTSIGNDKKIVEENLVNLKHGIEIYQPFLDTAKCPIKCAGTIKDFKTEGEDPEDWRYPSQYTIRRDVLRGFAPHCLYAYCSMQQAIEDAKLTDEDISNVRTGIYTASAGSTKLLHYHKERSEKVGITRTFPLAIVCSIVGTLSYNLVSAFKIKGASCGFASACASSSHALGFAYDEIASGRQDRMFIVGGEDGDKDTLLPFASMRALSTSDNPDTASRPFDKNRDGFVGTGGSVVMVIEDAEIAKKRGANIYAEILGWGQASDGYNVAIPHPNGDGVFNAITNALSATNVKPSEIDYINAHATSTPIGDVAELKAVKRFFGDDTPYISSTKALTGHGLSLAGVMEAGFCALGIKNSFIPGSANISQLDDEAVNANILQQTKFQDNNISMSLSSGFGGANTAIVMKKF